MRHVQPHLQVARKGAAAAMAQSLVMLGRVVTGSPLGAQSDATGVMATVGAMARAADASSAPMRQ